MQTMQTMQTMQAKPTGHPGSSRLLLAALLAASCATGSLQAQSLQITPATERVSAPGPALAYTGTAVTEMLFQNGERGSLTAAEITFAPGARTAWHNHPKGQFLIVTGGAGWVQARGEPKRLVREGDVVWTPPGVFHWHGATATRSLRHLAVWDFLEDSGGELQEQVSDADYLSELAPD